MVDRLADLFPVILIAAMATFLVGPLAMRLARRWRLLDVPGSAPHKTHPQSTPLAGGALLLIGLIAAYLYLAVSGPLEPSITSILAVALVVQLLGLADDRVGLSPLQKIAGQIVAAALLVLGGVQVRMTGLAGVDLAVTALWIVGMMNAFNFVDSKDGLALGLAMVAAGFFMLATIDSQQPRLALLAAALLGACLGTFYYNSSPAHLFLGDSGAQLLGFLTATIGIAYVPAQAGLPQGVSWFTPILVLGVPIFDMALVVFSRLRGRRPLMVGGQDHTYHRLVALGLDPTRSVVAMQLAAVLLGLIAFVALDARVLVANVMFGFLCCIGLVMLILLQRVELAGSGIERNPAGAGGRT